MNEKMTDEELERTLGQIAFGEGVEPVSMLRAHITALTAERDGLKVQLDGAKERGRMVFDAKNKMLDTLRERVHALEADLEDKRALANRWMRSAQGLHGSLAAIRQRAGDETALVRHAEVGAIMGAGSTDWDEEIHAEVVQRGDAETLRGAALAAARYILCDDARPSAPPEAFTHEKGLDAGVFSAEDEDPPLILPTTNARAAPTTPEAFATVRKGREWWAESAGDAPAGVEARRDLTLLALLERRMGAQEAAIRAVLATKGANTRESIDAWNALRASLTNAPPVFTLEEVRNVVRNLGLSEAYVVEQLTALRKTSP